MILAVGAACTKTAPPALSEPAPAADPPPPQVSVCNVLEVLGGASPSFVLETGGQLCLVVEDTPEATEVVFLTPDRSWRREAEVGSSRVEAPLPRRLGPMHVEVWILDRVFHLHLDLVASETDLREGAASRAEEARRFAADELARFRGVLRSGSTSRAREVAQEIALEAEARGFVYSAVRFRLNAALFLTHAGRTRDAERLLLEARALAAKVPVAWLHGSLDHGESSNAVALAAPRTAERLARDALTTYHRAGFASESQMALGLHVLILARLGKFRAAAEILESYPLEPGTSLYGQGGRLTNHADFALRAWRAGAPVEPFDVSLDRLKRAQSIFERIPDRRMAQSRRAEVAWWSSLAGRGRDAAAWLGDLAEADVLGEARGLVTLTRAQLSLLEGAPEVAIDHLDALRALPEGFDGLEGEGVIMGSLLRGRAELLRGAPQKAADAFAAALEASERLSLAVPFSLQPGASVRRRKPLREEALSALIDAGQRERAFQLDDRVRSGPSRRLRSERGLSVASSTVSEALRARLGALLAQGCLPPAQEAWCRERSLELLARIDDVVRGDRGAERVSSDWTIAELAQRLRPREELWVYTGTSAPSRRFVLGRKGLAPESAPMTEGLAHVYVVSDAQSVPRALLERHLDPGTTLSVLPYASWLLRPRAPRKAEETTVVVADPSGDLPFARREGDEVAALRGGARWIGRGLGAMALMNALRGVDVFHFAGHGTLLSSDPWTTLLRIGGTQVLTLEDWVGRSPQLRLAILDGCSTGGYRPGPGDLGFPQALLETGTRTVLATTRQVRDVVAYRFMEDFRKAGGHLHPGRGFRSAVAASRARKDRGWRAFQLWGDP